MRLRSTGIGYFLAIPDVVSLLNLTFGFIAILMVVDSHLTLASMCILVALIFDSVDGWVARKLERKDVFGFGMNIDSLADVVSFGAAPAAILYSVGAGTSDWVGYLVAIVSLLVLICGMLRLARYNVIAERINYHGYVGLPIPTTAIILVTYYLSGLFNLTIATIIMLLACYLMISTIRFPKFDNIYLIGIGFVMILILISPINVYLYGVNISALVIFVISLVYMFKVLLEFFIDADSPIMDRNQASQSVEHAREVTGTKVSGSLSTIRGMFDSVRASANQVSQSDLSRKDDNEVSAENMNFITASYGNETPNEEAIRSIRAAYPRRSNKSNEESKADEIIVEHNVPEAEAENVSEVSDTEEIVNDSVVDVSDNLEESDDSEEIVNDSVVDVSDNLEESDDSEEFIESGNSDGVRLNSDEK